MTVESIPRIVVESSAIAAISYSPEGALDVEFHRGALYRYFDVPLFVARSLLSADSKGTFFVRHIRDCFRSKRLK